MTLGHCWGKQCVPQLTRVFLAVSEHEIAFSKLSKTFRDAIVVTHRLGIKYLWIDSLCII